MFRKLLTLEETENTLHKHFKPKPLGAELVPLLQASQRVLAKDVQAPLDVPPFSRSTVDGFAVRAEDTFGAEENKPLTLKICGLVKIGEAPRVSVGKGRAAEIVTGAPMPSGADAVVMVEQTEQKNGIVRVFRAVVKDENVMKKGADIRKGETVLTAGQVLGSREIGVLAALGISEAEVFAVPRVAVFSTGPEVTELGRELQPGRIYDINAFSLNTAVLEAGGKPVYFGVFPDSEEALDEALRRALASSDMVLTSGGVSVGPRDVMPKVLDSLGKPGIIVHGIAIKPGKPTAIALIDNKLVFSLPGHPASALLVFNLLARPLIQLVSGRKISKEPELRALATMRMFSAKGRRTFIMVKLKHDEKDKVLLAEPVASEGSGAITTLAKADGFVAIPEDSQFVDEGETVTVRLFNRSESLSAF